MGTEIIVALIGAIAVICAAVVTSRGARALRQTQTAVQAEGTLTRESLAEKLEEHGRTMHARIDDVREDLDDVRESVARVREWQAGHAAEHLLMTYQPPSQDD
ncbi:hypothetical protein [Streptomyces sp. CAU 1734]|uniref:hypothetical protein n=1 Tax=Streptomyces sp. CAU 1734 TaxID=3140360 RepID=UPI00326064D8